MEKTEKTTTETESTVKTSDKPSGDRVNKNPFLSRKFLFSVSGLVVLWFAFWQQVYYLYSFTGYTNDISIALISAYVGLARDFMVGVLGIIMSYLGVTGFIQWRHGTQTAVTHAASFISEKLDKSENKKEEIHIKEEKILVAPKEDDYTLEG